MSFLRFLTFILIASTWFIFVVLIAAAISFYLPGPGIYGTALLILIWGSSFCYPDKIGKYLNFWVILFSAISCFSTHYYFTDWYRLRFGESKEIADLSEILKYPKASKFIFKNAVAKREITESQRSLMPSGAGGFNESYFHVIALTPNNWKSGDEVHAWLAEKTGYAKNSFGIDKMPVISVITVNRFHEYQFRKLISGAAEKFKIKVPEGYRVFEKVDSIQTVSAQRHELLLALTFAPFAFILVTAFIGLLLGQFANDNPPPSAKEIVRQVEESLKSK